jgi:predicted dehydrogenase
MTVNIAVVGLGYWGPNLARSVASLPNARLHTLCDGRPDRLTRLAQQYPGVKTQTDYTALLDDRDVDAVIVATPVNTHFELAGAALRAGKHVMVEKPLAQTSGECKELIALAEERHLTLMVGHVFVYNAAVRKVKEYIDSGELGDIYYIYSQRLNLGIIRQDVNALWNFAPHDLSILSYWLDATPERVSAKGYAYLQPGIEDVIFMTLDYPGGIGASVHISWLDPNKVRRMTVVGSKKMVVYDDVSADAKLLVFDKGFTKQTINTDPMGKYEGFGDFQLLLRAGDVLIPKLDFVEPLKVECQHFATSIERGERPITDGYDGLRVVQALEAAQTALGRPEGVEILA